MEQDNRSSPDELVPLTADDPLLAPPSGRQPVLVDPRPQLLPLHELTPDDFERLLLTVAREVDGLRQLHKYGVPGQRQHGLDIVGFDAARRPHGYQAKRYADFTERDLARAVEDYTQGERPIKVVWLVIGVATVAERTQVIDELAAQQKRNPDLQIELYDRRRLSDLLRGRPDIVEVFFGDLVAQRFCLPPEPLPVPVAELPLDTVALADAVMHGPVQATGVADVLAEANLDSRTANRPLVGCRSPRSASPTSRSWQRFGRCQANGRMGRFAEHESVVAPVARSLIQPALAGRVRRSRSRGRGPD